MVLHECLTDRRLFRGENELDTVRRIMEGDIPAPSSVQPAIPAALDAVALKALARPPEQRFQTAIEMAEAIEAAVSLASHREVAAYLERACGTRLAERRDALREMLAGEVAPLALELSKDPGDSQSSRSMRFDLRTPPESSGTDARIAVETPRARDERSRLPLFAAVGVAAAALGALLFVVVTHPRTAPAAPRAPETVATVHATATIAPSATSARADDVTVELAASASIESVEVAGSKRIVLAGDTAKVSLAPWTGPLKVEATLAGGKRAFAKLEPGETKATLVEPKARPRPVTNGAPAAKPDLQSNPYGAP